MHIDSGLAVVFWVGSCFINIDGRHPLQSAILPAGTDANTSSYGLRPVRGIHVEFLFLHGDMNKAVPFVEEIIIPTIDIPPDRFDLFNICIFYK